MRADPTRSTRALFDARMKAILRDARDDAIQRIREYLKWRHLDVDELMAILQEIDKHYIDGPGQTTITQFTNQAYQRGAGQILADLGRARKPKGFNLSMAATFTLQDQEAIRNLSALTYSDLKGISAETSRKMIRKIVTLDKQGAGITKISRALFKDFNELTMTRAEALSRTAINGAYNHAAWDRIQQYAPYKEWIPTLSDNRTRDSHLKMSGVVIPTEEAFLVPAFRPTPKSKTMIPEAHMMYPGDVSMDPPLAQFINCRCAIAGRFMKK